MSDRDCENCKYHTEKGCDSWDCNFERKVTRKETIKVLEDMKKGIYPYDPNVYLDIAINSLEIDERYELEYEQIEPCEDAISRQAVLNVITEQERLASDRVRDTPSSLGNGLHTWVNPAYTRYSAQLSERAQFKAMIQSMPPVTPQAICPSHGIDCEDCPAYEPKTGHWIEKDGFDGDTYYDCSECGESFCLIDGTPTDNLYNYCPNCGAKMEESEETE